MHIHTRPIWVPFCYVWLRIYTNFSFILVLRRAYHQTIARKSNIQERNYSANFHNYKATFRQCRRLCLSSVQLCSVKFSSGQQAQPRCNVNRPLRQQTISACRTVPHLGSGNEHCKLSNFTVPNCFCCRNEPHMVTVSRYPKSDFFCLGIIFASQRNLI